MSLFFKNNNEQVLYIKEKINKLYPDFKTGGYYFIEFLSNHVDSNSVVLDAGCGSGGLMAKYKDVPQKIIGIDVDENSLKNNQTVNQKILADLEKIPLADNTVDVVVSVFVLEHLKNPLKVFAEIKRVLKPNGAFIFITSNLLNPIMFFSKISPYFFHVFFRKNILKKYTETHQTYYLANTFKKISFFSKKCGFSAKQLKRAGNPEYLGFCKPLVVPSIFWEKIIDNKFMEFFKMYLIGVLIK